MATTFKKLTDKQGEQLCERIWKELTKLDGEDAWSVLAVLTDRFCSVVGKDAREHFVKWLQYDKAA